MFNFSSFKFISQQLSVLKKGPKFTPTSKGNHLILKNDIYDFTRRLHIKEFFNNIDNQDESIVRNKSTKKITSNDTELVEIIRELENLEPVYKDFTYNLSREKQKALIEISQNEDIVIKPSDKGGGLVIMNKQYYKEEIFITGHLSTNVHREAPINADKTVYMNLKTLVDTY